MDICLARAKILELAKSLGYTHEPTSQSWGHFGRGTRRVWQCRDFWQTADVIDNRVTNRRPFVHVEAALYRDELEI